MNKKPLLFIVLGYLHILEPLAKLLYFQLETQFGVSLILSNVFALDSFKVVFDFWLLFPLAGIALLSVKKWSYFVFILLQGYSIYSFLTYEKWTWPYVSTEPHPYAYAILAINIVIILVFLLPKIRRPFFDRSVRWWETKTRYRVAMPASLSISGIKDVENCKILNISASGAFIGFISKVKLRDLVHLTFDFHELNIAVDGEVVSKHSYDGTEGLGLRFLFNNSWERMRVKRLLGKIRNSSEVYRD